MKQITNKTILKQKIGEENCKCIKPKKIFKTYQPVEVDGVVYWVDENDITNCWFINKYILKIYHSSTKKTDENSVKIVAQSSRHLEGIPVISLDSYVEKLAEIELQKESWDTSTGLPFNEGWKKCYIYKIKYSQKDIEKAIELAREANSIDGTVDLDVVLSFKADNSDLRTKWTKEEILEQLNSISVIEVDEQFNVISYE